MAVRVPREQFELLAEKALADIPRRYRKLFRNVSILVQDLPDEEDVRLTGVPAGQLLGLFKGVSILEEDSFFAVPPPLPNAIYLYQKNIESICRTEAELIREIRMTLLHEVGHYFGMTEEDLEEFESGRG
ncbi:MAG TPA: metallopeptidase family protein [Dissulfurispiraceae bacterium]|nr:metallopeptidase family protein [Dissulfurispiraceae bacterium]